jgi:hypothetical protein
VVECVQEGSFDFKVRGVPVGCRGMKGMRSQKLMSARNGGTELTRSRKDR